MTARPLVLVPLLSVAIAVGCTNVTDPVASAVTPSVTVSPAPNASNVARGDTIVMSVNLAMDTASCRTRFTLHLGDSTGAAVPGHMRFGNGYQQMRFVPDSPLQPGTRYFALMRDSVMVGDGMGGMGMMGRQQSMMVLMFTQPPAGAIRVGAGMGWSFTTGG
jgi:hypothetical protein